VSGLSKRPALRPPSKLNFKASANAFIPTPNPTSLPPNPQNNPQNQNPDSARQIQPTNSQTNTNNYNNQNQQHSWQTNLDAHVLLTMNNQPIKEYFQYWLNSQPGTMKQYLSSSKDEQEKFYNGWYIGYANQLKNQMSVFSTEWERH
jgi:hypothetical protein